MFKSIAEKNILKIIIILSCLSSCAQAEVAKRKNSVYNAKDILIDSTPSKADIFIYPQGIIAKTPIYVSRLEVEDATIDFVKPGYQNETVFVESKKRLMIFRTFFGNLILLPLYPFALISDLFYGWDIKKPTDKVMVELKEANND